MSENPFELTARRVIAVYDLDKDEQLTPEEIKPFFINEFLNRPNNKLHESAFDIWFKNIDKNKNGLVSIEELMVYFSSVNFKYEQKETGNNEVVC